MRDFHLCSEIKLEEAAVLHFTYTKFSDLTSRRDRCGCKPTKEDVKRCFMLDFDRDVSILASHTATSSYRSTNIVDSVFFRWKEMYALMSYYVLR